MAKPKIVVIGSSNTDMVVKSTRIPVPGETVTGGTFFSTHGGKGANQAVAAARLGARVTFVSCVGQDTFGRQALEQYKSEGINTKHVTVLPDVSSGIALILVDQQGENMISVASGANARLTTAHIDKAARAITSADMVIMQLEVPLETVKYAAKMASQAGVRVILDPAPVPSKPLPKSLLKNVYCIKPNEREASRLTGIDVCDWHSAQEAAEILLARGVKKAVITRGDKGAILLESHGEPVVLEALSIEPVDTTGAGDAFSAALAYGLSTGHGLADAGKLASVVAAISTTCVGAQTSFPLMSNLDAEMELLRTQKRKNQ